MKYIRLSVTDTSLKNLQTIWKTPLPLPYDGYLVLRSCAIAYVLGGGAMSSCALIDLHVHLDDQSHSLPQLNLQQKRGLISLWLSQEKR